MTIEETYVKLSQKDHVLHRPGMYIGQTEKIHEDMWTMANENEKFVKRTIEFCPGFIKIFDEVLTNAIDHSIRDNTVNMIKINFDKNTGEISVFNNGSGIPIKIHNEHGCYVPELIFGHLLSGSNYNDDDKRIVAGNFGLGVKLSNIFSKKFTVETIDNDEKKRFVQEYSDNMNTISRPKITNNSGKSYTKITFIPDYERFQMDGLDDDIISLLKKRVFDSIVYVKPHVKIFLNNERIKGSGLNDYIKFYQLNEKSILEKNTQSLNGVDFTWEYAIVPHEKFEDISFVNGNFTSRGGKHVDYILNQILSKLKKLIEDRKKIPNIKTSTIKENMFLFLNSTIINPSFTTQTKEVLGTNVKDFGVTIAVSDSFIEKLYKSKITELVVESSKVKEKKVLMKQDGRKTSKIIVPKLEDAIHAGTSKSWNCTLVLTEGDSAKTYAMWGKNVVDERDYIGVYPLKGKVMNVRDGSVSQLSKNEEINNIKKIVGLKQDKVYDNVSELRYGKILLLCDSDADGSHIKSLLVNMFHHWWPSLLKLNFLQTLRTPIVKAIKGKTTVEFFTEQDYKIWKEHTSYKDYKIRYYKGLGTSTKQDAQEIFKRFQQLKIEYYYKDKECDESIVLAFEKDKNVKNADMKCSDKRKQWLSQYNKDLYVNVHDNKISFNDLIQKELIHFSIYDNSRSIPQLCDGLKPSQRKILYYMLKKNIDKKNTIKVAQLSGYVSAETCYHHGEASLQGAIINMAQDFVGSNNINLLYPDGNFGSRYQSGKDAASPRYIFTRLSDITTLIFKKDDLLLLTYLNDDGVNIEPEYFLPIIPMVLVNGAEGIGTGYSTCISSYNPEEIITQLIHKLNDLYYEFTPLEPYFKDFNGKIEVDQENGTYITKGKWEKISDSKIKITEIPVGTGLYNYKEFLESMIISTNAEDKSKSLIQLKDVQNQTKDENSDISIVIEFKSAQDLDNLVKSGNIEKELKLIKSFSLNNMYLFNENLHLTKYKSTVEIMNEFFHVRLQYYIKRHEHIIQSLDRELEILASKRRFIQEYIDNILDINRKSKDIIISVLKERNYMVVEDTYDYLLKLPVYSFTLEKIEELEKEFDKKKEDLESIKKLNEKDLWKKDLEDLLHFLKNSKKRSLEHVVEDKDESVKKRK
jgi:DNA topoisomerase-2